MTEYELHPLNLVVILLPPSPTKTPRSSQAPSACKIRSLPKTTRQRLTNHNDDKTAGSPLLLHGQCGMGREDKQTSKRNSTEQKKVVEWNGEIRDMGSKWGQNRQDVIYTIRKKGRKRPQGKEPDAIWKKKSPLNCDVLTELNTSHPATLGTRRALTTSANKNRIMATNGRAVVPPKKNREKKSDDKNTLRGVRGRIEYRYNGGGQRTRA
ncbi:hypothetical protein BU17DRAFT_67020 [Hysterangium stoloniferum]|nr:hypothetical protein BU17DRAFT_67020 [Hysterangium stoloniferum]